MNDTDAMKSLILAVTVALVFPVRSPGRQLPSAKEIEAADRAYSALVKRLGRIRTLAMYVVHGNFSDSGSSRTVHFPPRRKAKSDDPKTIEECFNLWVNYNRVSHSVFHHQKVTMLEHVPGDGGDGYGVLYVSDRTGWPVAGGYAPDRTEPTLTEFRNLRVTLKRGR